MVGSNGGNGKLSQKHGNKEVKTLWDVIYS